MGSWFYCLIIGILNLLLWIAYTLPVYVSTRLSIRVAEFMHKYFEFYFNYKIAHIFSIAAIIWLVTMLLKKDLSFGNTILAIAFNILWMVIYFLFYLN